MEILGYIFAGLTSVIVLFQIALAAGVPWGSVSMGGKFPGKYPPKMRFVAVVNALILIFIALIALLRAGIVLYEYFNISKYAIWGVVAFTVLSLFLNLITPSKWERRIWAPVVFVMLITSAIIAFS